MLMRKVDGDQTTEKTIIRNDVGPLSRVDTIKYRLYYFSCMTWLHVGVHTFRRRSRSIGIKGI